jgi:K(+)-stimulated pyrophosphate-energized sodium pump
MEFSQELFKKLYLFPIMFVALGLVSCIIGLMYVFGRNKITDPHKEMNKGTWLAAGMTVVTSFVMTMITFWGADVSTLPFKMGIVSPWVAAIVGVGCGIVIGMISEYYTS